MDSDQQGDLMNFISLFSGIGGFDYGFIRAGWNCIGYCELDKFAHKAFEILHDPKGLIPNEYDVRSVSDGFIRTVRNAGSIDAIVAGFPCQTFSIAGKRQGFKDTTRGTLFFEIARIAEIAKPRYLILENVKGLLNHGGGNTYQIILESLDELGYDCEWQVLNSKNFGVAQNRERVFIVGYLRGSSRTKVFPIIRENDATIEVVGMLNVKGKDQIRRVYSTNHLSPCLSTMQGGGQEPKVFLSVNQHEVKEQEFAHCLDANYFKGLLANQSRTGVLEKYKIRKLTPLECFRLQSYPDEWYFTLKEHGFSDTQLYKLAGNGVTSNVAYEIARRLIDGADSCN